MLAAGDSGRLALGSELERGAADFRVAEARVRGVEKVRGRGPGAREASHGEGRGGCCGGEEAAGPLGGGERKRWNDKRGEREKRRFDVERGASSKWRFPFRLSLAPNEIKCCPFAGESELRFVSISEKRRQLAK